MECLNEDDRPGTILPLGNELFVKHIPPARPVLLLVDGHSSHYEPETMKAAAVHGVVMFCLPPHCTHVAQLLDVICSCRKTQVVLSLSTSFRRCYQKHGTKQSNHRT